MGTPAIRKPRRLRRFLRTFFAHRLWLVVLALAGGLIGAGFSYFQERTYRGQLELAAAPDGAPTRVLLPDNAKLWQLVHSDANLELLVKDAPPEGVKQLERVSRSIQLEPISTQPTGSSIWLMHVDIPASSASSAKEMLNRYGARLDSEFQQRTLLVSRATGRGTTHRRSHVSSPTTVDSAVQPTAAVTDPQLIELANELGVEPDRLPFVIDQFKDSIERRARDLAKRESDADQLVAAINRIEAGSVAALFPAEIESQNPELQSLRGERDALLQQRTRLATTLKAAHPELKAVDRRIGEVEEQLKASQSRIASKFEAEIQRVETDLKKKREQLSVDRERFAKVQKLVNITAQNPSTPSNADRPPSTTPSAPPVSVAAPKPLPDDLPAATFDRPIGRVVIRTGMVDPFPVRPKTERNIMAGIFGGLLAYLVLVFLWAGSDQRIHSIDDLEGLSVDLNVFGSLPRTRSGHPVSFTSGKAL